MTEIYDPFWSESKNMSILYRTDRLIEFFITKDQNISERLNAITRFGIYASIILAFYRKEPKYLMLSLLIFMITYFIYCNKVDGNDNVGINGTPSSLSEQTTPRGTVVVNDKLFSKSTINNPYGNRLPLDPPNRPPMVDYVSYNKEALKNKEEVSKNHSINLFEDVEDIYTRKSNERSFYTNPDKGEHPYDAQGSFRNWLYGGMTSCKENGYKCNVNLRNTP